MFIPTGEELKKEPVLGPLKEYKNAVRRFLRYVLDNGIETEDVIGIRNPETFKQKKYVLVKVVNEKLEKLASYVMRAQIEQLEILRRIEEIQGLACRYSRIGVGNKWKKKFGCKDIHKR